jgi:hypothetical protein
MYSLYDEPIKHVEFLERFAVFAKERSIDWAIVGSYVMKAYGIYRPIYPSDLDIIIDKIDPYLEELIKWVVTYKSWKDVNISFICNGEDLQKIFLNLSGNVDVDTVQLFKKSMPKTNHIKILGGIYPAQTLEDLYENKIAWKSVGPKHVVDADLILKYMNKNY